MLHAANLSRNDSLLLSLQRNILLYRRLQKQGVSRYLTYLLAYSYRRILANDNATFDVMQIAKKKMLRVT